MNAPRRQASASDRAACRAMSTVLSAPIPDWYTFVRLIQRSDAAVRSRGVPLRTTPLHAAVSHRRADVCALLLARGADPNCVDMAGRPPLCGLLLVPCEAGAEAAVLATVVALIRGGVNVNARTGNGSTYLVVACQNHAVGVARALLDAGADASLGRVEGICSRATPLLCAVARQDLDLALLLVRHGVNPEFDASSRPTLEKGAELGGVRSMLCLEAATAAARCRDSRLAS
jgi:hypothetical protein